MIRLVEVAGARPNFMKIAPVHQALLASGKFEPVFVHTGQHYDWEMSAVFLRDLGLPTPDFELGVGSGTHAEQTAQVMLRLESFLNETAPDLIVVVGDVNSTLAAALTAAKLNVPVAHVEAGLRSFDQTMPEEVNRLITDVISDLLFAPSKDAVDNLLREGIPAHKIHLVGNVMIDSLDALLPRARESDILERLELRAKAYLLATLHRPSNVDTDESLSLMADIFEAVGDVLPTVLVAHPRTKARLLQTGLLSRINARDVRVIEPVGYIDFLALMSQAAGVLTDSGGIQEETTVLGIPCLTLRDRTERPITVTEGTNKVVGLDRQRVLEDARAIAAGERAEARRPDLWDGKAAERIVSVLLERFSR